MRRRFGSAYGLGREVLFASDARVPQLAVAWRESQTFPASVRERPAYDALKRVKHRLFVDDFVLHGNAARAARAAGYSESDAAQRGWRLCKRADIDAAIRERLAQAGSRAERAVARLEAIAFMPLEPFEKTDPRLINASRAACADLLKLQGRLERDAARESAPSEITMLEAGRRVAHLLAHAARLAQETED